MYASEPPIGEPLPLDLVNTRFGTGASHTDLLATPDGLAAWLTRQADRLGREALAPASPEAGLPPSPTEADRPLSPTEAGLPLAPAETDLPLHVTEADLPLVHAVRDHTEAALRALMAGRRPPGAALRGLADAQRAAPAVRVPVWDGTAVVAPPRRTGPLGVRLAALLAESAVTLLADPAVARVRQCAADDCVLLFLPAHPRRRWCSPTRCGNRVRVARHYRRRKEA
ncbi:CGNR zinc finger domain-containing protein [Streptomyces sp. NPDC052687]|uniref:CGNR zinc finger domain-containing protein n=1 Tax=Streptomyces sp. NPDC052687 TaxID=3154759 RepID=UPI00341D5B24